MGSSVLVAGLLRHDSGKTWVTTSISLSLRKRGLDCVPFKPVAGFNAWYSVRAVRESFRRGLLVSNDLLFYADALGLDDKLFAMLNPIAIMLAFPDVERVGGVARYLAVVEDVKSTVALARVYECASGRVRHYMFRNNIRRLPHYLRDIVVRLSRELSAEDVDEEEFISYLSSVESSRMLSECYTMLSEKFDYVVVESFNNAVEPYTGVLEKVSAYVVVAPGKLYLYPAVRVLEAVRAIGRVFASTVDKVFPLLQPAMSVDVPLVESVSELSTFLEESGFVNGILELTGLSASKDTP